MDQRCRMIFGGYYLPDSGSSKVVLDITRRLQARFWMQLDGFFDKVVGQIKKEICWMGRKGCCSGRRLGNYKER